MSKSNFCKNCNKPIAKKYNVFCNSSCSASYNNRTRNVSESTKDAISKSLCKKLGVSYSKNKRHQRNNRKPNNLISAYANDIPYTKIKKCTYCGTFFNYSNRNSTSCSDKCFIKIKTHLNRNGQSCIYKGIKLDSKWERTVAI